MPSIRRRTRTPVRLSAAIAVGCAAAVGLGAAALVSTPLPAVLLIRAVFDAGARATVAEMLRHTPPTGVRAVTRARTDATGTITNFDVYRAQTATGPQPAVLWIHGGAWVSGSRADVAPYLRTLARHGYTTIGLDYPVAPGRIYPVAVSELNETIAHILANASELGIDQNRVILAGDSAGAQLASQLAALTSNRVYADRLGMTPALSRGQLIGTILHCGVYDLGAVADLTGITGWGFKIALWAYTGTRNWAGTPRGESLSTVNFVTGEFPATFISGGNGDSLTETQSVPMAAALKRRGVEVTELFWPADHQPPLPHEYQFHLDLDEARAALDATLVFLDGITR